MPIEDDADVVEPVEAGLALTGLPLEARVDVLMSEAVLQRDDALAKLEHSRAMVATLQAAQARFQSLREFWEKYHALPLDRGDLALENQKLKEELAAKDHELAELRQAHAALMRERRSEVEQ